jgi:MazG family protein
MKKFDELLEVAAVLNGPEGCAWDKKQTFHSLQPYVLEEAHEVIEAVDSKQAQKIIEELGDLLYTVIFYGKIAQKEGLFSMEDIIDAVKEKLIRRHPHIFRDQKVASVEDVEKNWDKIKQQEKGKEARKSPWDGIPPTLPLVAKAQKIIKALKKETFSVFPDRQVCPCSEQEIGEELLHWVWQAEESGVDAESALRRSLVQREEVYRKQKPS